MVDYFLYFMTMMVGGPVGKEEEGDSNYTLEKEER